MSYLPVFSYFHFSQPAFRVSNFSPSATYMSIESDYCQNIKMKTFLM